MGPKMHAAGHNDGNNGMGGQNDDACGKIAKIQTTRPMTRAHKYSNLTEESFGPSIFGFGVRTPTEGNRSGILLPRTEGA
jgi:hypothetical protein